MRWKKRGLLVSTLYSVCLVFVMKVKAEGRKQTRETQPRTALVHQNICTFVKGNLKVEGNATPKPRELVP